MSKFSKEQLKVIIDRKEKHLKQLDNEYYEIYNLDDFYYFNYFKKENYKNLINIEKQEKHKEQMHLWKTNNKDKIHEYYLNNLKNQSKYCECCDMDIKLNYLSLHRKTKLHKNNYELFNKKMELL